MDAPAPPGRPDGIADGSVDVTPRLWRAPGVAHVVLVHEMKDSYRTEPMGAFVICLIDRRGVSTTRGTERHHVHPGSLGIWDPTRAHEGVPLGDGPWETRRMLIEPKGLEDVLREPDDAALDLEFPRPVVDDPALVARFRRLHRLMGAPASTLEHESLLAAWLQDLARLSPTPPQALRARRAARAGPAVRRACALMHDELAANLTLAQLAAAGGVSPFRLVRLFRAAFGLPPHAYQVAQRVAAARRRPPPPPAAGSKPAGGPRTWPTRSGSVTRATSPVTSGAPPA